MIDESDLEPSAKLQGSDLLTATLSYLRSLSVNVDADRLLNGLPLQTKTLPPEFLPRALARVGHVMTTLRSRPAIRDRLPCCVELKSGGYLVVLSRHNRMYHAVDPLNPEAVLSIAPADLLGSIASHAFIISPSLDRLNTTHSSGNPARHWFWGRIFDQPGALYAIIAGSLFANTLAVGVSLFSLQVYDRVIPGASEATLWVLASGVGLAILFEAWLRISRAYVIDTLGKEAEVEITRELFSRVLGMRMANRPASPAGIVHMVREFASIKEFFTTASVGVVADLPFVFIFLLLIYAIAGPVVWIIVIGAILIILPGLLFQSRMAQLSRETMGGSSSSARVLTEAAYGLETLKSMRAEPFFQKQWEEITVLNSEKTTEQRGLSALLTYIAASTQQLTYVLAVIAGVYMVFQGEFTIGSIIAIGILSTRTLSPVSQLASVLMRWQNMKTALHSLDEIMSSDQDRNAKREYISRDRYLGSLRVNGLEFTHPGSKRRSLAVQSLILNPGDKIALIGPIGSGKSTLLRLMAGLYDPDRGEILIDDLDLRQLDPLQVRRNVGYLPQETRLFKGRLRDNLAIGTQAFRDEDLLEALTFSGLAPFVQQHAEGLDLLITDGGEGLSVGQRQSVGLARLYLLDPAIVLLDEPTSAFDQSLETEVIARLGKWLENRTCVIATHRTPILSIVDRIALVVDGKIVRETDKDQIITKLSAHDQKM